MARPIPSPLSLVYSAGHNHYNVSVIAVYNSSEIVGNLQTYTKNNDYANIHLTDMCIIHIVNLVYMYPNMPAVMYTRPQ